MMRRLALSPKAKAMIPIFTFFLLFFLLLGFLRYYEIKTSLEKDEDLFSYSLTNAYVQAEESAFNFFTHRGFSCVSSLAIKEALKTKDTATIQKLTQASWNELQLENPYLEDMRFYDAHFLPLFSFEHEPFESKIIEEVMGGQSYGTFTVTPKKFTYNVFIPSICEGKFIGMVEFVLDVDYFLDFMKRTLNIETTLFVNTDLYGFRVGKLATICNFQLYSSTLPSSLQFSDVFKDLSACSEEILHLNERLFSAHIFYVLNKEGENLARFVFLYELTEHKEKLYFWIERAVIITFIFIVLSAIVLNFQFNILIKKLRRSENSLIQINKTLEERIEKEIAHRLLKEEESREKERIIIHQDKLASMGEMIGNIAHQWRQPLTELGSLFIRLEVCFDQNVLNHKELKNITCKAEKLITYMSQTIDDFRNFFSSNDTRTHICINDAFEQSYRLISAALKNHHIEVNVEHQERLFANGKQSELSQAILNILSNAKDVLIERNIKNPTINVAIFTRDEHSIIQIKDNAGGILFEPITKIFEPYISSKHASSGTGIGLYMTKNIIEKNQKGHLVAYNENDGAVFEIMLDQH